MDISCLLWQDIKYEIDFANAKMGNYLDSNLFYLGELIRSLMVKFDVNIEDETEYELYVNEIIAYLFLVYYGKSKDSNINKYKVEKEKKELEKIKKDDYVYLEDDNIDFGRADRIRKREKYLREGNEDLKKYLKSLKIVIPPTDIQKHLNQGRFYDTANMIMLDEQIVHDIITADKNHKYERKQKYTLFDLLFSKDICNSHSASAQEIAEAYDSFNLTYDAAQKSEDAEQYISHWVNFYRLECRMSYSLINKIADYMIENCIKEFPNDFLTADMYWKPTVLTFEIEGQTHKRPSDAIWVLRYSYLIPKYFKDINDVDSYYDVRDSRTKEALILNIVSPVADKAFLPYFHKDKNAINEMCNFCKYKYPIIESHNSISMYIDEGHRRINHKKIKLIRKIFEILTPPDEIKNYFGREKHKNSKKSV